MAKHALTDAGSIAVGQSRMYQFDGNKYLVYHLSDGYYATSHQCTHLFKSLEKGQVIDDNCVRCPLHRAEFNIRTGAVDKWACFPPGIVNLINAVRHEKALTSYKVTEEQGQYYLHA